MTDKMRQEFEAQAVKKGLSVVTSACNYMFANGATTSEGDYFEPTQTAWVFWQASREALVIELPPLPAEPEEPEYGIDDSHLDAYNAAKRMRSGCVKAIEAAGLKVSP